MLPQPAEPATQVVNAPLFTRQFWLACAMHFSGAMGTSLFILFPLFVRSLGGSELTIGVYAGVGGAAAVAARFPVGRLLDSQGRRRVLAAAGLMQVTSWLGFLLVGSLGAWSVLCVALNGAAGGSLFAAYFTYASDIIPATRRSQGFAWFGTWGMLPNGLGPLLGELLISRSGFAAYFMVAAACSTISLGFSRLLPEAHAVGHLDAPEGIAHQRALPVRRLLALLSITFVFGAATNSLFTFLAPFAHTHGQGTVGSFFMSYALAAVTVRVLTGHLPDRIGLRRVLVPAFVGYAVGLLLIVRVDSRLALIAVGALCGAGHGYAFPILSVLVVERVSAVQRGRAVSWFTAMFDLGNTLANPLLGALAEWASYRVMFSTSGLCMLALAALVSRTRQIPAGPRSHGRKVPQGESQQQVHHNGSEVSGGEP